MVAITLTSLLTILKKGYIRDEESNINLSLSYLNRSYNQETKDLYRKNRTGIKT